MREHKLAISIPSARDWKVGFGCSLVGLVKNLTLSGLPFDMTVMQGSSNIVRARRIALEWALSKGFSHILFIDDDMTFPADVVQRLLSHGKTIVAANYMGKATRKPLTHDLDGKLVDSEGKSGLQEVGWVGFGLVLIDLNIMKHIPKPWFGSMWLEDRQDDIGEDYFFCKRMQEHGIKIFIDHDVSRETFHIGDIAFGFPKEQLLEAAE